MKKLLFFADIPADEYHAAARMGHFLSSHRLADFRTAPILYRQKLQDANGEGDSPAFILGRAAHALILEGKDVFENEFCVSDGPVNPRTSEPFGRTTKAYREWAASQAKSVISCSEFTLIARLRESVWNQPVASALLADGLSEQTVRTSYCGESCQIRIDWFTRDEDGREVICDLKTCENLDAFERDARRFGYAFQMAFYREVLRAASEGKVVADTYLIAVEKHEPFRAGVWKLTDAILESAARANERAIRELQTCWREDCWPTRYEDIRYLDL